MRGANAAAAAVGLLVLSGPACAQFSPALGGTFHALRYYGLFPTLPRPSSPLDLKGFAPLPERSPPVGPEPDLSGNLHITRSGVRTGHGGIDHLEGGFSADYKGYRMEGDVLDANEHSEVFIISGNAMVTGPDEVVAARRIVIDYRAGVYEAYNADTQIRPSLVGGILESDVYTRARHGTGTEQEQFLDDGLVTTCNYPDPHYYLEAKYIDLRYRRRIIFRDLSIWVLGHHLLNLPFLAIPLDDRRYNNLPTVGQDPYEGYFIKTNYGWPLKGNQTLTTRQDYMTKLGFGFGFDYHAQHTTGKSPYDSELTVYGVPNIQMLDVTETHNETFKWGKFNMQNQFTGNDYLSAPGNKILNSQFGLTLNQRYGTTGFNYTRDSNTGSGFDSLNQTFGFTNSESLGTAFRESSQVTYTDSSSSYASGTSNSTIERKEIDVNFEADDDFRKAQAQLQYQREIPVGQSAQNFVGGTDRTPVITLATDSSKLFGQDFGQALPVKTDASIGQFGDPQSGADITRDRFDMSFDKATDPKKRLTFEADGQFSQSFYSDNTAQYVVGTDESLSYRLGRDTSANVRYSYLRPEGFTPLGIDQSGLTSLLSEDLSFRVERPLLFGVQSSYDFMQAHEGSEGWSPVGLRAEYNPHNWLLVRTLATYDPFYKGVANYRLDATYTPGATIVGLGARYDNTRSTWAEIDFYVSSFKWGRIKTDLTMSYNGYSKQFNSIQASLTYDLHCAEAIAMFVDNPIGFQNGTSFQFFIKLKGLPLDTNFGSGTRGQPFGYGTGIGY